MQNNLESFETIAPDLPLQNEYGETLPPEFSNTQYVDDLYNDTAEFMREMIAVVKRDMTESFPAPQANRLKRLLCAYRAAWRALQETEEEDALLEAEAREMAQEQKEGYDLTLLPKFSPIDE